MYQKRIWLLLSLGLLVGLILAVGCTHVNPVVLPEPQNHTRPVLEKGFYNCTEGKKAEEVCLTFDDAQTLMLYLVGTEVELRKCAITVHEVNQERKK